MTDKPDEEGYPVICGRAAAFRRHTAIADALVEDFFRRLLTTNYPCEPDEDVPEAPEASQRPRRDGERA
jgi:hypothetical protein